MSLNSIIDIAQVAQVRVDLFIQLLVLPVRLAEPTPDLQALDTLLKLRPFELALDVASLAAKREIIDLEKVRRLLSLSSEPLRRDHDAQPPDSVCASVEEEERVTSLQLLAQPVHLQRLPSSSTSPAYGPLFLRTSVVSFLAINFDSSTSRPRRRVRHNETRNCIARPGFGLQKYTTLGPERGEDVDAGIGKEERLFPLAGAATWIYNEFRV
jgi:hypothetical protein